MFYCEETLLKLALPTIYWSGKALLGTLPAHRLQPIYRKFYRKLDIAAQYALTIGLTLFHAYDLVSALYT